MERITNYKIEIGCKEYHQMISEIFEEKDKCSYAVTFHELLRSFPPAIDAAIQEGKYDFALVLQAQQIDNLYCSSGHAKKSAQLHIATAKEANEQLDKADEYAEATRHRYEEWRQDGRLKYPVHTAVWVYGYSARIKLSLAAYGLAKQFLQKAQDNFDSLCSSKPSPVEDSFRINASDVLITKALEKNCLLEAAFLHNCWGQFHRDKYIRKKRLKETEPEKAITQLRLSQGMYEILAHKYGLFTFNIANTGVYIVKTYLANQEKQDNWEVVVDAATLKDATMELNLAKQQNAYLKSTRKTANRPSDQHSEHTCRLDVLITFYQSFIYFKKALLPSTSQADYARLLNAAEDGIKSTINYDKLFSDSCNLDGLLTLISRLKLTPLLDEEIAALPGHGRYRKRSVHQLHQRSNVQQKTSEDQGTTTTTDSGIATTDTGTDIEGAVVNPRTEMARKHSMQEPFATQTKPRKYSIQEPYVSLRPQSMEGFSTDTEVAGAQSIRTRPMIRKHSAHKAPYVAPRPPSTDGFTTDVGSDAEDLRRLDTKPWLKYNEVQTHSAHCTDPLYRYDVHHHQSPHDDVKTAQRNIQQPLAPETDAEKHQTHPLGAVTLKAKMNCKDQLLNSDAKMEVQVISPLENCEISSHVICQPDSPTSDTHTKVVLQPDSQAINSSGQGETNTTGQMTIPLLPIFCQSSSDESESPGYSDTPTVGSCELHTHSLFDSNDSSSNGGSETEDKLEDRQMTDSSEDHHLVPHLSSPRKTGAPT